MVVVELSGILDEDFITKGSGDCKVLVRPLFIYQTVSYHSACYKHYIGQCMSNY